MMNRILVPLDGSLLAEHALAVAAKLARSTDGMLILVQALAAPVEYDSPLVPQVVPVAIEEYERQAQAYLTQKASLPMLSGIPIETVVLSEAPALAILNAAIDCRADMIVMTSHGRTGVSRWVFGSVAEHVARQAQVPVLVLRQHQLPVWIEGAELVEAPKTPGLLDTFSRLRVLVPLDGSPLAESVLEPAACCADTLLRGVEQAIRSPKGSIECLLHFVLVVRPFDALAENMPEALVMVGAKKYLKQVADRVHASHPDMLVTWEVIAAGDIADTLVTIAEGTKPAEGHETLLTSSEAVRAQIPGEPREYTLLAMATHGRTGIMRWVWGSITERVVHKTHLVLDDLVLLGDLLKGTSKGTNP
jgi:nucleotide-binding universal stress UspA family protein